MTDKEITKQENFKQFNQLVFFSVIYGLLSIVCCGLVAYSLLWRNSVSLAIIYWLISAVCTLLMRKNINDAEKILEEIKEP